MRKTEQGFTLVELIMVIVIIGILASVALPRFYDMQTDARSAKAEAIYGAIRSASAIAHGAALVKGKTSASGESIIMEGATIDLVYGYPAATGAGIGSAANLVDGADGITFSGTNPIKFLVDGKANCNVSYQAATSTAAPVITLTNNKNSSANCT